MNAQTATKVHPTTPDLCYTNAMPPATRPAARAVPPTLAPISRAAWLRALALYAVAGALLCAAILGAAALIGGGL